MMHPMVVFSGAVQIKNLHPVPPAVSGFILNGDVKDLSLIRLSNGAKIILAAVNNDSLRVFRINPAAKNLK